MKTYSVIDIKKSISNPPGQSSVLRNVLDAGGRLQ
jgi:hypothetical protein